MNLYEMNLEELTALYNDHVETYIASGCEDYRQHAITVQNEIFNRKAQAKEVEVAAATIKVYFEQGYKWSVDIAGQEESIATNVSKVEAMAIARNINKEQFGGKAIIEAQKLSKAERKENMSYLHSMTNTYGLKNIL